MRHGAPLLVALYLALIAFPLIHPLLESRGSSYHPCPAERPGWRIVSHPPEEPCSDPDHHHHPRPVRDEEHCPTCRVSGAAFGVLPFVGGPVLTAQVTRSVAERTVLVPLSPELLTLSARAPPLPASA